MTSLVKTRINKSVFYGFALTLILCVSSPFILNRAVNTPYIKDKILVAISKKTGASFNASKLSITLFPEPCIKIENFIFNPDEKTHIKIEAIKFKLELQKLLSGKINITNISVIHPEIKTSTSKSVISTIFAGSSDSQTGLQVIPAIKNLFTQLPEHQDSVEFEFKDVTTAYFRRMDGSFYLSKEKNQITLNTLIDDIDLDINKILNSPSGADFDSGINLNSIKINQLKGFVIFTSQGEIQGQCKLKDLKLKSDTHQSLCDAGNIDISFKISENLHQADIKPFKLNSPDATLKASFINNPTLKNSRLNITGTKINIEQARQMSLLLFNNNDTVDSIFEILHKGIVPKLNISFHGKDLKDLFNENNLKLKGNIQNGLVKIPETNLTVSGIDGNAGIKNGVLDVKVNKGIVQGSKIKKGSLIVDLCNYTDFPFQGEFELDLDLSKLSQTLIALLPDTILSKELLFFHNVAGQADAKLNLAMATQSDDLKVKVHADEFSVTGLYDRSLEISGHKNVTNLAEYLSNDSVFPVKTAEGKLYITSLDLSGSGSFGPASPDSNSPDSNSPDSNSPDLTSPDLTSPGAPSGADIWKYSLKGTASNINISTHLNQKEMESISCNYHISNKVLDLNNIHLKMNTLAWLTPFVDKKYIDSFAVPFDISSAQLQIQPGSSFLSGGIKLNSGVELNIELKGKTLASLFPNSLQFNDPEFSKGAVTLKYEQGKPLLDFKGHLNTITLNKLVKPDSLWAKKLNLLTEGNSILIATDQNSNVTITGKTINLNVLNFQSQKSSMDYDIFPAKTIHLKSEQLKIKKLNFTNIDSKIFLKQDGSYIKLNKAFLCDLETGGYINVKKDSVNFKLPIQADNKTNIQDLLTCLFQKDKLLDGKYSLNCDLTSNGSKKDFLKKIQGSMEFNSKKGRIYKLTLLSRILSVVNVSKFFKGSIPNIIQKGFGYKKIIVEADIKDSILYLNKAIIDGDDMTLIFKGKIDPFNDKIDLTCLVAPLKTVDLIIQKIPIVNTIMEGRLVSIPTKVSGKLSDPTVVPLHPSAVGKGIVNMMTNILKTPILLLDKIDGD